MFQTKKAKPAVKNIDLPFFNISDFSMLSNAMSNGNKATNKTGEVNGIGGQANQSKTAESKAKR